MSITYRQKVVVEAKPQSPFNPWGSWSFVGVLLLLGIATWLVKADFSVFQSVWDFLTGHVASVPDGSTEPVAHVVQVMLPLLAADLVISASLVLLFRRRYPETPVTDPLVIGGATMLMSLAAEEIFARLLFLGILTQVFHGTLAFYILFLLGNSIWALLHLVNFKKASFNPMLVLPQFVGGLLLGYLFVRYGFWVTFWCHVVFDALVFSVMKKTKVSFLDLLFLLYAAVGLGITIFLLHANNLGLANLGPWVSSSARNFPSLPGLSFWEYALLLLAVNFASEVIASLLLLDNIEVRAESTKVLLQVIEAPLGVLLIFGIFWALGFVVPDVVTRVVIISVLEIAGARVTSGSAFARVVLVDFPVVFLLIGVFLILGFWEAVALLLIMQAVGFVPVLLRFAQQNRTQEEVVR